MWSASNLTLDLIAIAIHFGVWTIATLIFEFLPVEHFDLPSFLNKVMKKKPTFAALQSEDYVDDDVTAEEKRVAEKSTNELQVRVSMFNKVYNQMFKSTVAVKQASFGL